MSEPVLPISPVFTDPGQAVPVALGTDPVVATGGPVAVGGINQDWNISSAGPGQLNQVVVTGEGTRVNLGTGAAEVNATGAGGAIIESVQLVDSQGKPIPDAPKVIAVGGPNYNGVSVDIEETVAGNSAGQQESIRDVAGGFLPATGVPVEGFAYYVHGGTGNDQIRGSSFNDFLRGGSGDDVINAGDGQDLVRGGTGNDTLFLGQGLDTLYYTDDQVGANNFDLLADFTSGEDSIRYDTATISAAISADNRSIVFTNLATGGVTTLVSGKDDFKITDLNFLA